MMTSAIESSLAASKENDVLSIEKTILFSMCPRIYFQTMKESAFVHIKTDIPILIPKKKMKKTKSPFQYEINPTKFDQRKMKDVFFYDRFSPNLFAFVDFNILI